MSLNSFVPSGPSLIFIAALLWALDGVLRRSLYGLPPITIVFLEHVIGLLILSPFLIRAWKGEKLTRREWGILALVALFSGVLGTLFFTSALLATGFVSFSVVFLIQKLQPLFSIATARLVLKERIGKEYLGWAALALVAAYFVTFPGGVVNFGAGGAHLTAALLAFLAAFCWGSSTAFSRLLLLKRSHVFVTGARFLLTTLLAVPFLVALGAAPSLSAVTPASLGTLALIAVSTGMLALLVYYRGLRTTPASVSAIVELAFPLAAVFVDYFLYGTVLAAGQYAAAAVLLFAMWRVARLASKTAGLPAS